MKTLILATSHTPPNLDQLLQEGLHHRIDYVDLARRWSTRYLDYDSVPANRVWRYAENAVRADFRLAGLGARLVKSDSYDLVFSMSERVGISLSLWIGRRTRHVVQVAHPLSARKLYALRLLGIPRRWDEMILPTQAEADGLRHSLGLPANLVRVLRYPVDTAFYHPLEPLAPTAEPEHIESLGLSRRDYPTLIRAMRRLPHVTMYIRAGSSWVDHATGYEDEPLPKNVQLKPFVSPHELRECYMRARVIVVSLRSTTQWSAGCTTVTQSQAMGRPVIVTDNPGIREYLVPGGTGLLVKGGDVDAWAVAIDYLWSNRDEAEMMGHRGRLFVEQHLSYDEWIHAIEGIIEAHHPDRS